MYFGWRVVGGSFLTQVFTLGFFTYSVSLLTQPVQATFGASVEQVMYSLTMGTFFGLFAMPAAGILVDRVSVRLLMCCGVIILALGLWLLSMSTSIYMYIGLFGLTMALGNSLAGSMIASTVVSRWFSDNRGKALGLTATGTSVGGVLLPALITLWLPEYGWRGSLQNLSIILLLLVLPVMFWSIRSWPAEVGIHLEAATGQGSNVTVPDEVTMADILRNRNFWLLGLALGLLFCSYSAILSNLSPYARDLGLGAETASAMIMTVAVCGLIGKLAFGMAADKFSHKAGLLTAQVLVICGFLILASEPSSSLMFLAAAFIGLATGGMLPVWGALMADLFGLQSYGRAMGMMGPVITLTVMPGFPLAGRLYDATGSYSLCLMVFAGMVAVSACLLLPLRLQR